MTVPEIVEVEVEVEVTVKVMSLSDEVLLDDLVVELAKEES